jgi:2-aminoadipate transaminase
MKSSALSQLGKRIEPPSISWLMHAALSKPNLISLAAGFTDNDSLPVSEIRESLAEILSSPRRGQAALQYGSTQGDVSLRQLTSKHLAKIDGELRSAPAYSPERMIITNGSQQMLYMITEALCDPDDIVLVEDPTYFVYLGILQSHGIQARGVSMESDGLNLESLESVLESLKQSGELRRVKALYLVTYFQNPTGTTTAFEKKIAALKLLKRYERAAGHPIYLLEDAAYRELRFKGDEVPTALAISGGADRVIYAGTYSKPFATGTRVGFGILPEPVFTAVLRIKGNHDFGTSNLLQQLLAHALKSGRYDQHLRELRQRYARKAAVMAGALRKHFPTSVEWADPEGGLYFWAKANGVKTGRRSRLFADALANEVLYVPGEFCYANDSTRPTPNSEMRLSFGSASELNIRRGIERLGKAIWKNSRGGN